MTAVRTHPLVVAAFGVALMVGAQGVRRVAASQRARWPKTVETPYAPSPAAAPMVALGYRELAADLLWVRALGYFGGDDDTAEGVEGLVDAIVALDPQFWRVYEWGGRAVDWVDGGTTQADRLWAVALLEHGTLCCPDHWRIPFVAGQIYIADLETDDPHQRAAWDLRGAELLERAVRMPGAPRGAATLAAYVRTKLGQQERAVRDLKELILTTTDAAARQKLVEKLAAIEQADAADIEAELAAARERFDRDKARELPMVPDSLFVILGDNPPPYIDLAALAAPPPLLREREDDDAVGPATPDEPAAATPDESAVPAPAAPAPAP